MSLDENRVEQESGRSDAPVWGGELGRLCNSFMAFDELYSRFAKSYGESYFSLWTLEEIGDAPEGITQKQMTSLLHLPKQTLSSIVASLVKRGLVETKPSPTDGRSKVHTLTKKGRALYERECADLTRIDGEVCQVLGPARVAAMNDAFEEVNAELGRAFERLFEERLLVSSEGDVVSVSGGPRRTSSEGGSARGTKSVCEEGEVAHG